MNNIQIFCLSGIWAASLVIIYQGWKIIELLKAILRGVNT